ncbi:MAG: hypothetical protein NZM40_08650 [Sphingomonadaceae bacterium]|uniref:hypothetical protein n=1 Tax=Thermaurantiacus sp. TaxID=2820283 RepID=UPI00298F07B4|nr:hypothetical protein [Thermaurantiacus sp.]MCS6987478.1 hypothetical protein [Sphingomonadaceae bacterium]MDW8415398.1 hypothetical protein [Thermaurantiacus sp.]
MQARVLTWALLALAPAPAHAYIGPGAGAGAIVLTLGVLAALAMAFLALLWYPLKRRWKRRRSGGDDRPGT